MTATGSNTNRPLGNTNLGISPRRAQHRTADALTPSRSAISAAVTNWIEDRSLLMQSNLGREMGHAQNACAPEALGAVFLAVGSLERRGRGIRTGYGLADFRGGRKGRCCMRLGQMARSWLGR